MANRTCILNQDYHAGIGLVKIESAPSSRRAMLPHRTAMLPHIRIHICIIRPALKMSDRVYMYNKLQYVMEVMFRIQKKTLLPAEEVKYTFKGRFVIAVSLAATAKRIKNDCMKRTL